MLHKTCVVRVFSRLNVGGALHPRHLLSAGLNPAMFESTFLSAWAIVRLLDNPDLAGARLLRDMEQLYLSLLKSRGYLLQETSQSADAMTIR